MLDSCISLPELPRIKLNDGKQIPVLAYGLGSANFDSQKKVYNEELVKLTKMAIDVGYRHIDGAQSYLNEEEMGEGIRQSGIPREELFITTKYASDGPEKTITEAFENSLKRLKLDYVDLYLIHNPFHYKSDEDLQREWAEMEAIRASGRAKSIGVSNFLQNHLEAVLKTAKTLPAINQIEYHPYIQQDGLIEFNKKHGIAVASYGPLTPLVKDPEGQVVAKWEAIAKKNKMTTADIGLRWVLDQDLVVVTTSTKEERLRGFLTKLPLFRLEAKDMSEITELGREKFIRRYLRQGFASIGARVD